MATGAACWFCCVMLAIVTESHTLKRCTFSSKKYACEEEGPTSSDCQIRSVVHTQQVHPLCMRILHKDGYVLHSQHFHWVRTKEISAMHSNLSNIATPPAATPALRPNLSRRERQHLELEEEGGDTGGQKVVLLALDSAGVLIAWGQYEGLWHVKTDSTNSGPYNLAFDTKGDICVLKVTDRDHNTVSSSPWEIVGTQNRG